FLENFEKAKDYYIKCLAINKEDSSALYSIIYCVEYLDQPQKAIDFLMDYIEENPYSEIAWHQLGLQYVDLDENKKALEAFDFAIISDDSFMGAYMEKAKLLEKAGNYEEAIECYFTTLKLEDATAFAYLHIGECYNKMGQTGLALEFFNKSLQTDPLLDKTWIAITEFYFERKHFEKALYYIEKAISIDEKNFHYWKFYKKINQHLDNAEKVRIALHKLEELSNSDFENRITTCDILIEADVFEEALTEMEKAEEDFPETAEIEYRLAGLYLSLNKEEEGLFHLHKALNLDSDYAGIMEELFPEIFYNSTVQSLLNQN